MKYTANKLCTKLVSFTRLYRDARSTERIIYVINLFTFITPRKSKIG